MTAAVVKVTAEQRNEKVRAVLRNSLRPLSPSEIGRLIGEPWCCISHYGISAAISPVCKRIGALRVKGGWALATTGGAA